MVGYPNKGSILKFRTGMGGHAGTVESPAPLDIIFSGAGLSETATAGDMWGVLIAIDPGGAPDTWQLLEDDDGVAELDTVTGALTLPLGASLDYETATSHSILVRAHNRFGRTRDETIVLPVLDFDEDLPEAPPVNTVDPFITGTTKVGHVLIANSGTWTGNAVPGFTYQWKRGGSAIFNAVEKNYLLIPADLGFLITCDVTGRNQTNFSVATTAAVGPITASEFTLSRYISPNAAGNQSGDSWVNSGGLAKLSQFIGQVGADGIVYIRADAGNYTAALTTVGAGGTVGHPVTIRGVDINLVPTLTNILGNRFSPWPAPSATAPTAGPEVFRLLAGANNLSWEFVGFRNCGNGCFRFGDNISNVNIESCAATNVRRFIENTISGAATTASISGLTVSNLTVRGYSRGVARIRYDSNNLTFTNVFGDSEYQDGDSFACGVALESTVHDVSFVDCEMRRHMYSNALDPDPQARYWQGDGYSTEATCYNVTWLRCGSFMNADGGWDCKGGPHTWTDCISGENKRNYRIWDTGTLTGCQGRDPFHRGGTGGTDQFWFAQDLNAITLTDCAFVDNYAGTSVLSSEESLLTVVGSISVVNTSVQTLGTAINNGAGVPGTFDIVAAPANSVLPVISGTSIAGETLTCTTGAWVGSGFSYAFQWKRDVRFISQATSNTYVLTSEDIGKAITCTIYAKDSNGYVGEATSLAAGAVEGVAPAFTSSSAIGGLPRPGVKLTASVGSATGFPTPTHLIQWQRDGANISGAISATFTPSASDVGHVIRFRDTATNTEGSVQQFSNAVTLTPKVVENLYIGPVAAGLRNGSGWANQGELIASIDSFISGVLPGSKIYVAADQGEYHISSSSALGIHHGGDGVWDDDDPPDSNFVTVQGVDADLTPNHTLITSSRTHWANYAAYLLNKELITSVSGWSIGNTIFTLGSGANYLIFDHFRFENVGIAFDLTTTTDPGNGEDWLHHIELTNIEILNARRGTENNEFSGQPALVGRVRFENWDAIGFSKDLFRIRGESHHWLVKNCVGDAGRQDRDNFCEPVQISDHAHDIELIDCEIYNAHDTAHSYYNGDGFSAEGGNYNIYWEGCISKGHTDACIDTKQGNDTAGWLFGATGRYRLRAEHQVQFKDCEFGDSKKGLKYWGPEGRASGCTFGATHHRGGSSGTSQLLCPKETLNPGQTNTLIVDNCTFNGQGPFFETLLPQETLRISNSVINTTNGLQTGQAPYGYMLIEDSCTGTALTSLADFTTPTFRAASASFLDGQCPAPLMPLGKVNDVVMFMGLTDHRIGSPPADPEITSRFGETWNIETVQSSCDNFRSFIGWRRLLGTEIGGVLWSPNTGTGFAMGASLAVFGGCVGSGTPYEGYAVTKTPQTTPITITIATPGVISWPAHGFVGGNTFSVVTTGALPTGITAGAQYVVTTAGLAAGSFRFSTSSGGTPINTSGTQSGVHTGNNLSNSSTSPAIVVSGDDRTVMRLYGTSDNIGVGTAPAGYTQVYANTSSVAGDISVHLLTKTNVDTGTAAATTHNIGGAPWISHGIALIPQVDDPQPSGIAGTWMLDFEDTFTGSSLDLTKWRANWLAGSNSMTTPPVGGTAEDAAYVPTQVTVTGGNCVLSAVVGATTVSGHTYPNKSGIIQTNPYYHIVPTSGHPVVVEARINLQASSGTSIGNFPAFWLDGANWPTTGEIDIVEGLGGAARSHFHYPAGSVAADGNPSGDSTGWHIWAVKWTYQDKLEFYRDEVLYGTITPRGSGYQTALSSPMYIICNLAVGSAGGVDVLPGTMLIDYVRAWKS